MFTPDRSIRHFLISLPLYFLCLIAVQPAIAQVSVNEADLQSIFTAGQSLYFYNSDSTVSSVNIGKQNGPNIYDFSAVKYEPLAASHNYQVSDVPVLAARFPGSAVTFGTSPDSIEKNPIFLFGNDTLFTVGQASLLRQLDFVHYRPYPVSAVFPITFGNKYWYTFTRYDTLYDSTGRVDSANVSAGRDTVTVDGYGTLKIPGHEFNCLRVKIDHVSYGDKEFMYMTREGAFVDITMLSDQPDTGVVQCEGITVILGSSIVAVNGPQEIPRTFSLSQNYPNPFNPSTDIGYSLASTGTVTLKIYDILGREVATLVDGRQAAGTHHVVFDGSGLASGVYFYRLSVEASSRSAAFTAVNKMILLK